jgi:RNA polymerase sigma factor (sigma-70 family)
MNNRVADVERLRRELAANPHDRVAWHNIAAAFGDLGHAAQAEDAARRAIALGLQAPETWLVLARALQTLRRLDEAQRAFERAIELRPAYAQAHRDLAQLIWMRTGDAAAALRPVQRALRAAPRCAELHLVRSLVLEFAGDPAAASAAAERGLTRAGDDAAYEALLERFQTPVYQLVCRLIDDPNEAGDVVQDVFLKVFRGVGSFRGQSSLKTWIYRIAVNEAHNRRRWFVRHRRPEVVLDGEEEGPARLERFSDQGRTPYDWTLNNEMRIAIEEALKGINPVFRSAVVLRDLEELSYE